ncbi:MAG: hypothetical protein M1396_00870, partial [Chloroflexi bacterium]|nr:hypothetical protein [Chloroflexota bacterium]
VDRGRERRSAPGPVGDGGRAAGDAMGDDEAGEGIDYVVAIGAGTDGRPDSVNVQGQEGEDLHGRLVLWLRCCSFITRRA